jgi:hypothetical protein
LHMFPIFIGSWRNRLTKSISFSSLVIRLSCNYKPARKSKPLQPHLPQYLYPSPLRNKNVTWKKSSFFLLIHAVRWNFEEIVHFKSLPIKSFPSKLGN